MEEQNRKVRGKPLLLHYYITNRCNAKCSFCSIWQEQPKQDAASERVEDNLKQARKTGCSFVDFTGGEPLLHPDLPKFLKTAKKLGYITSVTTNCLLFPERRTELSGLIDLLHFSIDADSSELHDSIRGCRSFDKVIESIDLALASNLYPDLLFTYTASNINALDGIYQLAREKKLVLILDPVFDTRHFDSLPWSVHEKALVYSRKKGVYLNEAHLLLRRRGGNHIRSPRCRAIRSTVVILPDDRLALPCYHHRCTLIPIDGKLKEILKSEKRSEALNREGTYSFCEGCHINCYFDPSFQFKLDRLLYFSLKNKMKYALMKYLTYGRPLVFPRFLKGKIG
ncbi:MAG: radical SAM protein [Chitinispirillaceae bacterium]